MLDKTRDFLGFLGWAAHSERCHSLDQFFDACDGVWCALCGENLRVLVGDALKLFTRLTVLCAFIQRQFNLALTLVDVRLHLFR